MAKIALVSDVHLGTRQYGMNERYDDFLASFTRFGQDVAAARPDAVVIGGDLFDSPRPDAKSVYTAQCVVQDLVHTGIPVYGIDGNHDLSGGFWLKTIGAQPLDEGHPDVGKVAGVRTAGLNYRNGRDLVEAIHELADAGHKADILVAHFALAEMNGGGSADTGVRELSPLLDELGVKCVMMGHVHIQDARKWNGVLYVNPGSTEMKSSNEPHDKFWYMVDTDTWDAAEVPLRTRSVDTVDISDEDELLRFQSRLEGERLGVPGAERTFYQVLADDQIDDAFKRIAKTVHDTSALARIVMRSSRARDVVPVVDRAESVATLESAIEARFPKESDEARLTASFLHSPDQSAIHLTVSKFMEGKD